jgi:hypothetical protein
MLDASLVRELVEAEDLLPVIWKAMARIWESERALEPEKLAPEVLKAFYDEREEQMFRLERFLSDTISDLYELLLQRAIKQEGDYVLRWLQGNNAVIIAALLVSTVGFCRRPTFCSCSLPNPDGKPCSKIAWSCCSIRREGY